MRAIVLAIWAASLVRPQTAPDLEHRVRSLYEQGQWKEAARLAAEAEAPSADLRLYRGLSLARLGQLDEAETEFLSARQLFPGDPRFTVELAGVAYRNQDNRAAKRFLHEALRSVPDDTYGNDFLATLYVLDGNLPAALKYWNRIHQPLIRNLRFAPEVTLDSVLRERTFEISPGQVLTLERLGLTKANLDRLGVLAEYQFDLTPEQDQRFDLTFRSVPMAPSLNAWWGRLIPLVRGLPYRTVCFDHYNFGGRAINLTFLGRWDPNKRRVAVSLSGPVRLNPRWGYRLLVDARDENWDLSTTYRGPQGALNHLLLRKIETGADLEFGLSAKLQFATGLRVAGRDFRNGSASPFFRDGWSLSQRNGFDYRLWEWPERRARVDASALLEAGRLFTGSPSRFATVRAGLSGVWLPQAKGDKMVVEARVRSGKTFGAAPFDEWFMLGMERDNDLWLRGHVGTRDGRKGNAPLGREFALFQSEFDRTLWELPLFRVQMGPFFDTGWIADPSRQFGSHGWMQDAGVQVKIATIGAVKWSFVYGRDLRDGRGVFYTAVSR